MNGIKRNSWVTGQPIDYIIELKYPLFSKARPRMTRSGHTYMPQVYKDNQRAIAKQIREQWPHDPIDTPIHLHLEVYGEGRGDTDNIAGALMDSAQGILWTDDRVTVIAALSICWHKAAKKDSRWILHISKLPDKL